MLMYMVIHMVWHGKVATSRVQWRACLRFASPPGSGDSSAEESGPVLPAPTGLQTYSRAPIKVSRPGLCLICRQPIVGCWRFDYRVKASRSFSDQRRLHLDCLDRTNGATLATDSAMFVKWLSDASKPPEEVEMLIRASSVFHNRIPVGGGAAAAAAAAAGPAYGLHPGSSGDP